MSKKVCIYAAFINKG